MSQAHVLCHRHEHVATLTLNRPARRNAFDTAMYDDAATALRAVQEDDTVHVALVTGAGSAFSAGQDLAEMERLGTAGEAGGAGHGFTRFMDALVAFDKPLVAAVNGVGVGIGFTMLLHCDLVYLADSARLRLPFVPLGVVPEAASSVLLPRTVGWQTAADLIFTGTWIDARRAVEVGIALAVCPDDTLLATAQAKAHAIADGPLAALRASKRLLQAARADAIAAARRREDVAFAECLGSHDNADAIRAFFRTRRG